MPNSECRSSDKLSRSRKVCSQSNIRSFGVRGACSWMGLGIVAPTTFMQKIKSNQPGSISLVLRGFLANWIGDHGSQVVS